MVNSLNTQLLDQYITLAPNPTLGATNLTIPAELELQEGEIKVINEWGSVLFNQKGRLEGQFQLDLSSYPSGLYFMAISNQSGVYYRKLIHY